MYIIESIANTHLDISHQEYRFSLSLLLIAEHGTRMDIKE